MTTGERKHLPNLLLRWPEQSDIEPHIKQCGDNGNTNYSRLATTILKA